MNPDAERIAQDLWIIRHEQTRGGVIPWFRLDPRTRQAEVAIVAQALQEGVIQP